MGGVKCLYAFWWFSFAISMTAPDEVVSTLINDMIISKTYVETKNYKNMKIKHEYVERGALCQFSILLKCMVYNASGQRACKSISLWILIEQVV